MDRVDRSAVAGKVGVDAFTWSGSEVWSAEPAYTEAYRIVVEAVDHQTLALHHALAAVAEHGRVFCFGVPDEQTYPVE